MRIVRVAQPAAIDQLRIGAADPRPPQPGEVMVRGEVLDEGQRGGAWNEAGHRHSRPNPG